MFEINVDVDSATGDAAEDMFAQTRFQFSEITGHEEVDLALLAVHRGGLHTDYDLLSGMASAAKSRHAVHARFYQRSASSGERETPRCGVWGKGLMLWSLLLCCRWRLKQVGTIPAGPFESTLPFPFLDLAVVARKENLRNLEPPEIDGLCIGGGL